MKALVSFLALAVAFVLQAQLGARVALPQWRPDFILSVVLTLSLLLQGRTLAAASLAAGLLESVVGGGNLGAYAVSRIAASYVSAFIVSPVNVNVGVAFVVAVIGSIVAQSLYLLLRPTADLMWWLNRAVPQCILTGVLVALFFPLMGRFIKRDVFEQD